MPPSPRRDWLVGLLAALVVTAWAWLPWLHPQLNPWERTEGLHDGKNHLLRLYVLGWMVKHGVLYPRWIPDLFMGYGYPILNYYAPGFYYLALLCKALLRLDTWAAYRAAGVVAALVGAAGAYALATTLWRRRALGVLAAVAMLYGPYAFQVNLWRRGDVPEVLGLALIPWLLLGIWRLWWAGSASGAARWLLATAAVGGAQLVVHNLTALTGAALAGAWVVALWCWQPGWRGLRRVALAGALAAGLAAFFWLPAILERNEVQLEWAQYGTDPQLYLIDGRGHAFNQDSPLNRQTRTGLVDLHLHYPQQLVTTPLISLSQVGLGILAALAMTFALVTRRPAGPALPLLLMAAACWALTLRLSAPLWAAVPALRMMQFPSRFLGPATVCLALAAAGALAGPLRALERLRSPRWGTWGPVGPVGRLLSLALVALVGGAVVVNGVGARDVPLADSPSGTVDGGVLLYDELYDNLGMGTTSGREFLPRAVYLPTYTANAPRGRAIFERLYPEADWAGGLLMPLGGDLRLLGWRVAHGTLSLSVRVANDSGAEGALAIRQVAFPGWRAWVDGRQVPLQPPPYVAEQQASPGFLVVGVPPGEHTVEAAFGPTAPRLAGTLITWLAGTAALLLLPLALGVAAWPVTWRMTWTVAVGDWRRWGTQAVVLGGALGLAYLTWRGIRPLWPGQAGVPVPAPAASAAGGVWQAGDLDRRGAGLLVNLAEAARTGQALVESPSGAALGPERFVDVRQLTVTDADDPGRGLAGTSRRQWLYMHPPAAVTVEVALPAGRQVWLHSALALDPAVWTAPVGDGVRVQPLVAGSGGSAPQVVLDRVLNPRARTEDRRWVPVAADLSPWAGSTVRLTLKTLPRDDASFDWAGWGNPVISVLETARALPPVPGTP